jgi:hypothetical protein
LALLALGTLWRWRLATWMAGTIRIEVHQSGRAALWLRRLARLVQAELDERAAAWLDDRG